MAQLHHKHDRTEQKTRQESKTQGLKKGKQIMNQDICVVTHLNEADDHRILKLITLFILVSGESNKVDLYCRLLILE